MRSGSRPRRRSTSTADVNDAIRRMHDKKIDCVLVTEGGRLVGIFTDRDAVVKVAGLARETRPIGGPDDPRSRRLRHDETSRSRSTRWRSGGFRHIPIVEDGRPTGVVTARDVFRHLGRVARLRRRGSARGSRRRVRIVISPTT